MTIAELRQKYTFIAYGSEYDNMKKAEKLFDWLIDVLERGNPTSATCHEWRTCLSWLRVKSSEYKKALKKLPKPTKDQRNDEFDPWTVGKWPEDKLHLIEDAYAKMNDCQLYATRAETVITHTQFMKDICNDKIYESELQKKTKHKKEQHK